MGLLDEFDQCITLNNKHVGIIQSGKLIKHNIQIPNIQRLRDDDKISDIVAYQQSKLRLDGVCNFLGTINIHYCEENKQLWLIDGQHRFEAVRLINSSINIPVIIELVLVKTVAELKENYTILNKSTPMPDFPETIDKSIPENVAQYFRTRYPTMWSKSTKARRPHIYFDFFQEALGVLTDKLEIQSAADLQSILEDYNEKMGQWVYKDTEVNLLSKCYETGFYLGMAVHANDDYGYEWVKDILKSEKGIIIKKATSDKNKKKGVPKNIRNEAWTKHVGNKSEALCICCRTKTITPFDFHAGHVISEADGGPATVENIRPVCSACNLSMGKRNMTEFVATHYPANKEKFDAILYEDKKNEEKVEKKNGFAAFFSTKNKN